MTSMCSLLGSSWGRSGCILLLGFTDTGRSTDQVFKMSHYPPPSVIGGPSSVLICVGDPLGAAHRPSAAPTARARAAAVAACRGSRSISGYPATAGTCVIELAEQRRGLVVGQIERHAPNEGALTLFAESTVGASGDTGQSQSATGTFFLCSQ